jgi:ribosomal protein S27AE
MTRFDDGSRHDAPRRVQARDGELGPVSHVLRDPSTRVVDWLLVRRGTRYHALPVGLVAGWEGGEGRVDATVEEVCRASQVSLDALSTEAWLRDSLREVIGELTRAGLLGAPDAAALTGLYDVEPVRSATVRCGRCGAANEEDASVCGRCGRPLGLVAGAGPVPGDDVIPPTDRGSGDRGSGGLGSGGLGSGGLGSGPVGGAPPVLTRGWPATRDGTGTEDPGPAETSRSLIAELPEEVGVDAPFAVQVSIVRGGRQGGALFAMQVPAAGADVKVVAHAPGLVETNGRHEATVHVPDDRDSDPSLFEFRAREPGRHRVSLTAYRAGTFLGRLEVEVLVTARAARSASQRREARIATEEVGGEVTLTVLHDEVANAFTFHFSDGSATRVVTGRRLRDDLRTLVERIIPQFDAYASGTSGLTPAAARARMENQGLRLWQQLIPEELKTAFRERQDSITQLTVLCEKDVVPWELLYPHDRPGDERGFMVEQFPVVRWVMNTRRTRRLTLDEPQFVVSGSSPPTAVGEVQAIRQRLGTGGSSEVIGDSATLRAAIGSPGFDCLHFACHNYFAPDEGSTVAFTDGDFQPIDLQFASVDRPLAQRGALVFLNACRSQGVAPTFTTLDGWAGAFLDAGASFFIGTSWAVRDSTAREFAEVVYGELKRGETLGVAVTTGRRAISGEAGDSTWLAYTVYGDPRATVASP